MKVIVVVKFSVRLAPSLAAHGSSLQKIISASSILSSTPPYKYTEFIINPQIWTIPQFSKRPSLNS